MEIINWLLEDNNPAVKYRTQTELLGQTADITDVKTWIFAKLPQDWFEAKGLWYTYYITALAECGLNKNDIPLEYLTRALDNIENNFEYGCADFMLLRSLVKLGFVKHPSVTKLIDTFSSDSLPDGGFLCIRRLRSFDYTPKSCYKVNVHALMFLSECAKCGVDVSFGQALVDYFLKRDIFYKSNDKTQIITNEREGWRIIDTFHPFEPMRVGVHNIVESLSALGYGQNDKLKQGWDFLYQYKNDDGKMLLSQTLSKSYLPKEKVGQPSKWVTFYTLLAEKEK